VHEETGLDGIRVLRELGVLEQPGREHGFVHESDFLPATPTVESPEEWEHPVTGKGTDAGLVYPVAGCRSRIAHPFGGRSTPWSRSSGGRYRNHDQPPARARGMRPGSERS
jgi:hypothetical protein